MSDISFEKVVEVVRWLQKPKVDYQKEHILSRCPLCGDSKTKKSARCFHINYYKKYGTFIYKCHRCGLSSNIVKLYSFLSGLSYQESEKYLTNKIYDSEKLKEKLNGTSHININDIPEKHSLDIDLIKECISLTTIPKNKIEEFSLKKLKEFKEKRNIPDNLPIYFSHTGKYKGRIIIPIYINNKLVYFQGRSFYDDIQPKYLNPEVEKHKIILNSDKFNRDKWIVVTEGIIDAFMIEENQGTCVIGGYVDLLFVEKLQKYTDKGVIICLDNPKIDNNSYGVLKKLVFKSINKHKERLKFFIMPNNYNAKDLNDLSTKYNIKNMYDFVQQNSHGLLKTKLYISNLK